MSQNSPHSEHPRAGREGQLGAEQDAASIETVADRACHKRSRDQRHRLCQAKSPDGKRRTREGIHLERHCDHGHLPADQRDDLTDA